MHKSGIYYISILTTLSTALKIMRMGVHGYDCLWFDCLGLSLVWQIVNAALVSTFQDE